MTTRKQNNSNAKKSNSELPKTPQPQVANFTALEKACIDFYWHCDSEEHANETLWNMLQMASTNPEVDNWDRLERGHFMHLYKQLSNLLKVIYKMPIPKDSSIDRLFHSSDIQEPEQTPNIFSVSEQQLKAKLHYSIN